MADSEILNRIAAARRIVLAHTDLLHREFGHAASHWKWDGTRVTTVDIAVSEGLKAALGKEFPDDEFFSEELTHGAGAIPLAKRFAWVLDPIDGTNNFAVGLVHCAIALALLENGTPVYGVVYDFARRVLIHGGPGFGLFDGDREARVQAEPPDAQMLLGFHSPYHSRYAVHASALLENFKIRALGSSTLHLAYVAVGIFGGVVDHNVKIWDIAAAIPLCLAGGGEVQFLNGEPLPMKQFDLEMPRIFYIAGNAAVCAKLRGLLT
jgi:myo-inositol-1(or 4)-monophosphatase